MTKEELKKEIADIEAGMNDLNAEEKEMVRKSLANAKKQLADMEGTEKPAEAKKEEKTETPKKEEPVKKEPKEEKKEEPAKAEKDAEPKKDEKKEIIPSDTLTPSELQRVKEVYAVLKKANYVIVKRKGQPDKRMTRVKDHSQSYKHAKRIIENVPVIFRPATVEISKSDKKEKNKGLISEVERMKDFLTIFMNDLDLIILTESEKNVKTINNWLIDLIKKSHENDFSFKYDGRAKIKEIAKKHKELSVVKFAGGGCILD